MQPATATVMIRRPRAAVHALLADLARHRDYLDHFLVDWTMTSATTARLRAKGGGEGDEIDVEVLEAGADEIVLESRSGRRGRRRMRLVYAIEDVSGGATRVAFTLHLVEGSVIDQVTWSLPRSHLERQYAQGLLRLKGLLEGDPPAR